MVSVALDQVPPQDNSHGDDAPSLDEDVEEAASALFDSDDDDVAIAESVPNDEPISIGIRLRDESPPVDAPCTLRNSFRAVVLDAEPVIDVTSRVDELHPNQLKRDLIKEVEAYHWQRVAFRCCVLISLLGVGLGVGLGLYGSSREGTKQDEQQLQSDHSTLDNENWLPRDPDWEVTPLASGETCADDPSWQGAIPDTTCEAVAINPRHLCGVWKGFRNGEVFPAYDACRKSCTACDGIDPDREVVPPTKPEGLECINSKEWHSFLENVDCDFVKTDPSTFCGFVGKGNLELAFMACPESCFEECV